MNAFADETPEPVKPQPLAFVQIAAADYVLFGLTAMGLVYSFKRSATEGQSGWVRLPMTEAK